MMYNTLFAYEFAARLIDMETIDLGIPLEPSVPSPLERQDDKYDNDYFINSISTEVVVGTKRQLIDVGVASPVIKCSKISERSQLGSTEQEAAPRDSDEAATAETVEQPIEISNRILNKPKSAIVGVHPTNVARPIVNSKGHTAYLTFAMAPLSRRGDGATTDHQPAIGADVSSIDRKYREI
jgi:hypothetical protein